MGPEGFITCMNPKWNPNRKMGNVSNGLIVAGSALGVCPLGKPLVLWVTLQGVYYGLLFGPRRRQKARSNNTWIVSEYMPEHNLLIPPFSSSKSPVPRHVTMSAWSLCAVVASDLTKTRDNDLQLQLEWDLGALAKGSSLLEMSWELWKRG